MTKRVERVVSAVLVWFAAALGQAQEAPGQEAPAPDTAPQGAPPSEAAPSDAQAAPPSNTEPDPFPVSSLLPVLLVVEGLDSVLPVVELRRRLGEALGREIVSLTDAKAMRAQATVWVGASEERVVIRVTPPQRPEVWRQLTRNELTPDATGAVVKAVLEMLWADAFARLDAGEIQDPFCPPGVICVDARRPSSWPAVPEAEVLDPWDSSYRRFYGWEPYWYRYGSRWPSPSARAAGSRGPGYERGGPHAAAAGGGAPAVAQRYAVGLLAGGGVHRGGAMLRYEVNALKRFPRFDFGLTYVGARGQPESFQRARRSVAAMLQRRFVSQEFELDLGVSFGIFSATFDERSVEVRPYLRGLLTFALPLGRTFDLLVQSDLGTTFASVPATGAVEYALSMGLRHRM